MWSSLLTWAGKAITENEDTALSDDGNVDDRILNEDNANDTLRLNMAKKES